MSTAQKIFQVSLTESEANTVLQLLGGQPTHTGVYPLAMKIKGQCEAQTEAQPEQTPAPTTGTDSVAE